MPDPDTLKDAWLVAAWPGMGNVAIGAAAYLVEQLGATLVHEFPANTYFETKHVEVHQGLATPPTLPRSRIFEWRSEQTNHDLLIFLGEAQPSVNGHDLCRRIIDYASARGVTRVFTFAAMATQLQPSDPHRVFGAATNAALLPTLREFEVTILENGQIGGNNGLLLAAGAERGIDSVCLLGELPFFAAGIQNPGSSMAALVAFSRLARLEIDFAKLEEATSRVQGAIIELLEQMKEAARQSHDDPGEGELTIESETEDETQLGPELSREEISRIEALFQEASYDQAASVRLKEELDRLGVFGRYEDRFLDLFRRGE